jgi:hypothetical protein
MLSLLLLAPTAPTPCCRLAASLAKSRYPSPCFIVHPSSFPYPAPASRMRETCTHLNHPCSNVIHRNYEVGHQNRQFSALRSSRVSVSRLRHVNKDEK